MRTRFLTPPEMTDYFEQGKLREDLLQSEIIAICSIADLLDVCEAYKKGNLNISHTELRSKFKTLDEGPIQEGSVFIVDLDEDNLSAALFERNNGDIIDLWSKSANQNISPKRSIRHLTLRITDDSIWWSENVYQEMEEYYASRDK